MLDRFVAGVHALADRTLAPTPQTAEQLGRLGIANVHVWGRGVDSRLFHPVRRQSLGARALRERAAPNGELLVGYVGRLAAEKQVGRLRDLLGMPGARFLVVGDGPERPRLEQAFAGHPVAFTGQLQGPELADAFAALDVFVHFGTEETFGQTIQEAQATGLPVVAPAVGGPLHLVEEERTGLLVDPGQRGGSRRTVERLAADPALRARLGEAGRRAVLGRSWEANNRELLDHYRAVIDAARVRTGAL